MVNHLVLVVFHRMHRQAGLEPERQTWPKGVDYMIAEQQETKLVLAPVSVLVAVTYLMGTMDNQYRLLAS